MTYTVKRKLCIALMLVLMLLMLVPFEALAQEIVDSNINQPYGIRHVYERKSFYDATNGYYYVFAVNYGTSYFSYYSSPDAVTWSPLHQVARVMDSAGHPYGDLFSIWWDGTYVYYSRSQYSANDHWCRGTPDGTGHITWSAESANMGWSYGAVSASAEGHTWYVSNNSGYAYENLNHDGTWATAFSQNLNFSSGCSIVPLTGDKMFVVGQKDGQIKGARFTGSTFALPSVASGYVPCSYISQTSIDDTAYIVFLQATTYNICFIQYDYSTNVFSNFHTIYDGASSAAYPVITKDESNNYLYVTWAESPTDNHAYIAVSSDMGNTWSTPYDWVTDPDGINSGIYVTSQYSVDLAKHLVFYYIAGTAMLNAKNLGSIFEVNTLSASPVGLTSATLRGEIVSLGFGSATERGFVLNDSPTLVGASLEGNETGTFNVGVFTHGVTGLNMFSTYWYAAYASNEWGTSYGNWTSFDTVVPIPTPPSGNVTGDTATICSTTAWNFLAMPITNTDIKLTWDWYPTTGNSSVQISIRYDLYHYPGNTTDGTLIYQGTSDVYTHTNLIPGTTYYYRGWLLCGGNYSADYVEDWATTYGSSPVVSPPEQPGGWFQDPSCTAYGKIPLLSDALTAINSGYGFPMTTVCVMFTLLWIIILGFVIFLFIHSAMMMVITIAVLIILASIMGLLPLWMIVMTICLGGISIYVSSRT